MKATFTDNRLNVGKSEYHEGKLLTLSGLTVGKEYDVVQSPGNKDQYLVNGVPYGKDRFDLSAEAIFGGK